MLKTYHGSLDLPAGARAVGRLSRSRRQQRPDDPQADRHPGQVRLGCAVIDRRVLTDSGTAGCGLLPAGDQVPRRSVVSAAAAQHLGGELGVHRVQVVAQRGPRHGLPAVVARQLDDPG